MGRARRRVDGLRDFGHDILLGEVQILLVLRVNIHLRVLPAIDLAILGVVSSVSAHFERHLVKILQFLSGLLGLLDLCHFLQGGVWFFTTCMRGICIHIRTCVDD